MTKDKLMGFFGGCLVFFLSGVRPCLVTVTPGSGWGSLEPQRPEAFSSINSGRMTKDRLSAFNDSPSVQALRLHRRNAHHRENFPAEIGEGQAGQAKKKVRPENNLSKHDHEREVCKYLDMSSCGHVDTEGSM
jgi:hypothetical protein